MSEDDGVSSIGGLSDEGNASLVGFGEGASSTTSGPISGNSRGRQSGISSPVMGKASAIPPYMHQPTTSSGTSSNTNNASITSSSPPSSSPISSDYHNHHHQQHHNARLIDGMTYDPDVVDTAARSPQSTTYTRNSQQTGTETAERIMRERAGDERGEGDGVEAPREARGSLRSSRRGRRDGREGVGRFYQQEER
jgi:hypothetical protein